MVCLTRGVIEETKQYMFNTTNNTCSIQDTYEREQGKYVCHFANWLFGKRFGLRFGKRFAKCFAMRFADWNLIWISQHTERGEVDCNHGDAIPFNLNKGTQRIWQNVILFLLL